MIDPRRIAQIRPLTAEETADLGWDPLAPGRTRGPMVLQMEDGSFIVAAQDEELNGPGALVVRLREGSIIPADRWTPSQVGANLPTIEILKVDPARATAAGVEGLLRACEAAVGRFAWLCSEEIDEDDQEGHENVASRLVEAMRGLSKSEPAIPRDTMDQLNAYLNKGIQPGGFLTAVLSNDLMTAARLADSANRAALPTLLMHLHAKVSSMCFGSWAKVQIWLDREKANGMWAMDARDGPDTHCLLCPSRALLELVVDALVHRELPFRVDSDGTTWSVHLPLDQVSTIDGLLTSLQIDRQ